MVVENASTKCRTVVVDNMLGTNIIDADLVVHSLSEAADWVNTNGVAANVLLVPGRHEVRRGAVFRNIEDLNISAPWGEANLVGGVVLDKPEWVKCEESFLERFPPDSRPHVRCLQLSASVLEGWSGGLSGPVHSGHWVPVTAGRSELFVAGKALTPARWPTDGYASIESLIDGGSIPREDADDFPVSKRRYEAPRGGTFTIAERDRLARWATAKDIWASGFWNWDWSDEQLPISKIDTDAGSITLGLPHMYGLADRGKFFITNLPEELNAPGQYWIDKDGGTVYAWLPAAAGTDAGPAAISLLQDPLITLDACPSASVHGLRFSYTRGEGIVVCAADGVRIDSCAFSNIGTRAVAVAGRATAVSHCTFEDIGGIGVELDGGDRDNLTSAGNAVTDCRLHRCGRVLRSYQPAVRLKGCGQRVAHCEIAWHPHTAVLFDGNDHVIECNDVHDVVLDTGDAGAVYCGRDWTSHGSVIRGNVFANIAGTDERFQNGVYLDDMASGIAVSDNLFVRCNWGALLGGGRDLAVRRNAFAACRKAVHFDARGADWMAAALADPDTSTLHRRLAAMPVDSPPWRSRFPTLAEYLTDRFGRPAGGVVEGTILVGGTPLGTVEDPECVCVGPATEMPVPPAELDARCDEWLAAARRGGAEIAGLRFGPVGPRPCASQSQRQV